MRCFIKIFLLLFVFICSSVGQSMGNTIFPFSDKSKFSSMLSALDATYGTLCWVGDSITEQGKVWHGNDIGFTTYIENQYSNATYINEGIGGNTSLDVILRLTNLREHKADLYVVAIGMNDARYNNESGATSVTDYISNMGLIVSGLQQTGATVVLVSIFPTFWQDQFSSLGRYATDERIVQWNLALEDFASDRDLLYLDAFSKIVEKVNFRNVAELIPDGVHPAILGRSGAKKLFADSILYDDISATDYSTHITPVGNFFFKLVVEDNDKIGSYNSGGYCGISNISSSNTSIVDSIAYSANAPYSSIDGLFNTFDSSYLSFYNKANDFPMNIVFSSEKFPSDLYLRAPKGEIHRGVRSFKLFASTVSIAMEDLNHSSWTVINSDDSDTGVLVNALPRKRDYIFYKLRINTASNGHSTVKLKGILGGKVVKVWEQNIPLQSTRFYDELFTNGLSDLDALEGYVPSMVIAWEAEEELSSVELVSHDNSLGDWVLSKSIVSDALNDTQHLSWEIISAGTGDSRLNL